MPKIVLKGFILVPSKDLPAVQSEIVNHKNLTLKEPGCLVFEVTQAKENSCRFDVYEEFIDKAAFEMHQERVRRSLWGKVAENVERHYEILV
ncbi:MAG: putative quinol monooxygenase [Pseudomonadales bacterium]